MTRPTALQTIALYLHNRLCNEVTRDFPAMIEWAAGLFIPPMARSEAVVVWDLLAVVHHVRLELSNEKRERDAEAEARRKRLFARGRGR